MKKKLNAHMYLTEKLVFDYRWSYQTLPNGYLYSNGTYATKIRPEDLPEYYIEGIYYGRKGYLDVKNIIEITYRPNLVFNHAFKDDSLSIIYADAPTPYYVFGGQIPGFVKAVKKYAGLDMSRIEQQIRDKLAWFKETYPDFYELEIGSWVYEP